MAHTWKFFRAGGFDQVRLERADDLLHLRELDPKLWVALSCPTKGVEFDAQTLALLDTDGDGFIRPPELLAAIDWAAARLADTEVFSQGLAGVPVAAIGQDGLGAELYPLALRLAQDGLVTVAAAASADGDFAAQAQAAWEEQGAASLVLGAETEAAAAALQAVSAKIDDWFLRVRLAGFDARAEQALNASEDDWKTLAATLGSAGATVQAMPLARVQPEADLPLCQGINPAWAEAMGAFYQQVVLALLGARSHLRESEWRALQARFAPYYAWQGARPNALAPESALLRDLERLARYVRDLLPLANNVVAFRDFYTRQGPAIFQLGTLYLDGRSAELCVAVSDPARHVALAGLARMCLVYCDCVRPGEKISIAAAFTAGDADQLMVGRNGVFYDRAGRDWQATITRIVEHPISLSQAFWSPYKRLARLAGEQLQKVAGGKAKEVEDKMAQSTADLGKQVQTAPKAPAQQAFDVGKFAGIFAAIGLALGAIGTAFAAVITSFLSLVWWQMPLALLGALLVVSGPSVLLAWFKLRSRNLGPLLDANGWAVNARARINIPFGGSLTQEAQLPDGAERQLTDPYAEQALPWKRYALLLVIVLSILGWRWLLA